MRTGWCVRPCNLRGTYPTIVRVQQNIVNLLLHVLPGFGPCMVLSLEQRVQPLQGLNFIVLLTN